MLILIFIVVDVHINYLCVCVCVFLHVFLAASSGTVTINADSTVQILVEDAYPLDMFDAQVRNNNIMLCTVYNYTVYMQQ